MTTPAIIFGAYFIVGLLLVIVAIAGRGKEKRAQWLDATDATMFGAGVLVFIALLWPVWLAVHAFRSKGTGR